MHRGVDFDPECDLTPNRRTLSQDLELDVLFEAMSGGDAFLFDIARTAVLTGPTDPNEIRYRQAVLQDCLAQDSIVREMYTLAVEAIQEEKQIYRSVFTRYPDGILHHALQALRILVGKLKRLRRIADDHAELFSSYGFTNLFAMLVSELDDEYFAALDAHLKRLEFRDGVLMSAELGEALKGTNYTLRRPWHKQTWFRRLVRKDSSTLSFQLDDRDEGGARALRELRDRGINLVANALAQSTDHIVDFFTMLRCELGFYVGCLNLHEDLRRKGKPTCLPVPLPPGNPMLCARDLYDVGLAIRLDDEVVGNDIDADGKNLVLVTGANQGGKSTFLRSLGVAQLMMQCGMFAPAASFSATVCDQVFTHYKREEDTSMTSGKLDEELSRMSAIADAITPHSVLLCNESFASTNEREGAEIASGVLHALLESGVRIYYVTHLFELARRYYEQGLGTALFLRAERHDDGRRTFRIVEGEPRSTSFGEDLYRRVFGDQPDVTAMTEAIGNPAS